MKKAVCISCTHHYSERIVPVEKALQAAGYDCTYITSDFIHNTKEQYRLDLPNCLQLHVIPYAKNISFRRLYSHYRFAKAAMAEVQRLQPDLLYVEVPPNSLCRAAALYKKANPQVKLVVDIFDVWPESFPSKRAKQLLKLPFRIWAWLRNCGFSKADVVFTECNLYRQVLEKPLKNANVHTLHLCRPKAVVELPASLPAQEAIHLCYLGSINNLIDIPTIAGLIKQVQLLRPVVLHIIGDGESREDFLTAVRATGAKTEYYGKIYDPAQRQAILDVCSFGLNIMKDSVCIGMTMKSLDYFAGALPIVNSIGADTWDLVERRQIGINLNRENPAQTAGEIAAVTPQSQLEMRNNTLSCFRELFTEQTFIEKFTNQL